jgi:C4-dicarboxylate transporter DctQ subunit
MKRLGGFLDRIEEDLICLLLAAMTLVTFVYVVVTNVFPVFYDLGDHWPAAKPACYAVGDAILGLAQSMYWSNALTKAMFAGLIFLGISYGVRTAGHLGVDALVKLAPRPVQRALGLLACLACLFYAGLFSFSSYDWVAALLRARIGAEDLGKFGVLQGYIAAVVPLGFALVFVRYLQIGWRIVRGRQTGLGLADETAEAARLAGEEPLP